MITSLTTYITKIDIQAYRHLKEINEGIKGGIVIIVIPLYKYLEETRERIGKRIPYEHLEGEDENGLEKKKMEKRVIIKGEILTLMI